MTGQRYRRSRSRGHRNHRSNPATEGLNTSRGASRGFERSDAHDESLPAPSTSKRFRRSLLLGEKTKMPSILRPNDDSGRRGIHPWHFLRICFRSHSKASMLCNILWPVVPAALAVRYTLKDYHNLVFTLSYIAMVPCANLIGFAGQEFSRKFNHVFGVLIETTCGSIVEIILFINLLRKDQFEVIKAAILGSILATMLLCLGLCFLAGGLYYEEQKFSEAISEAGSGLLLTAGVALSIPTVFHYDPMNLAMGENNKVTAISRVVSILLIISYCVFVFFQARTHHGIYDAVFEYEQRDSEGHVESSRDKLTMTECIIALSVSIALVTIIAITLVAEIEHVIEHSSVSDAFMGLILVPFVEKFAEHLTAVDDAWDNQMNFALSNVLGATLQTALLNAPLTVIVGWGLHKDMNLDFNIFNLVMLLLSILTVGRFLQDQKSNYLEGLLLVILYIAIAVSAWYFPNPLKEEHGEAAGSAAAHGTEERSPLMALAMAKF